MKPLVSVILPTFNRAALLPRAITSVLRQTVEQWELIIIADNCTDGTSAVIASFGRDPRIIPVELTSSAGGAEARNIGMRRSRGDYVAFLDDDDEWLPEKLAAQLALFGQDPGCAIVSCNYVHVSGNRERTVRRPGRLTLNDILYENGCGSFSFCMIRGDLARSLEIDPKLQACQDWDLWIKVLHRTRGHCAVHQDALVRYHEHGAARLTSDRDRFSRAYLRLLRSHFMLMDRSQRFYNLAYLAHHRNCSRSAGAWPSFRSVLRSFVCGLRSRRVRAGGYLSFLLLPWLVRVPGWGRIERTLFHIFHRYLRRST